MDCYYNRDRLQYHSEDVPVRVRWCVLHEVKSEVGHLQYRILLIQLMSVDIAWHDQGEGVPDLATNQRFVMPSTVSRWLPVASLTGQAGDSDGKKSI